MSPKMEDGSKSAVNLVLKHEFEERLRCTESAGMELALLAVKKEQ